jgi:hypothetical protein
MVRSAVFILLAIGSVACWNRGPTLEDFLLQPTTPPIGSIQARMFLIQGILASQRGELDDAIQFFEAAHQSDPHATIQRLAQQCLNPTESSTIDLEQPEQDDL